MTVTRYSEWCEWLSGGRAGPKPSLRGANLVDADLRGADLRGADLCDADLYNADLRGANLSGANLGNADLRGADLRGADLGDADLRGADLGDADLCDADLRGVDLRDTNLCRANLHGANLLGAKGLPAAPSIDRLDERILELVDSGDGSLDMCRWHTCETTHCRAGWAIVLAGEAGAELERECGPELAGALIYHASTGRVPDFHVTYDEAIMDMRARAGRGG